MNGMIRTSVRPGSDRAGMPRGAARQVRYGDRIFVRVVSMQQCWRTVAEFELDNVADMSDIYGELRFRTRGERGLMRLYVRNATQGWSFEQPLKLYGTAEIPAAQRRRQPAAPMLPGMATATGKRRIPESIQLRYGVHSA